jgi:putative phage-type endonuclease
MREKSIGSSEVGSVLGVNEYKSAYALWAEKTAIVENEFQGNEFTEFGKHNERFIAELYAKKNNFTLIDLKQRVFTHPEFSFATATPDFLIEKDGELQILEVKTSRNRFTSPPPSYVAQVLWQLAILNHFYSINRAVLCCLCAGDVANLVTFEIQRDPGWEMQAFQKVSKFWQHVETKEPLDFDFISDADASLIAKLKNEEKQKEPMSFSEEIAEKVQALFYKFAELDAQAKELESQTKDIKKKATQIKNQIFYLAPNDAGTTRLATGEQIKVTVVKIPKKIVEAYEFVKVTLSTKKTK